MSVKKETLISNPNPFFIETGTYKGFTTRVATNSGFDKVFTIELQDYLYEESVENLTDLITLGKVEVYKGDSAKVLPTILNKINDKTTILLDAHIDDGNFISGETPNIRKCPLYEELTAIKEHKIKEHTIIIDDVRILGKIGWGNEVVIDKIIDMIKSINNSYKITYEDGDEKNDVLIAKIK